MVDDFIDRSTYLKGLLVLTRKDNVVTSKERDILNSVGSALGFEKQFLTNAINELLENEFISDDPPVFTNNSLAHSFIKDGIKLALNENEIKLDELNFLLKTANLNNIGEDDFRTYLCSSAEVTDCDALMEKIDLKVLDEQS